MLLVADEATPVISGGRSAIVGQAFTETGECVHKLDDQGARSGQTPPGTDGCWGNFVAFAAESAAVACAYREPSGSVPLYHLRGAGGDIFLSDADLGCRLGLLEDAAPDPAFAVQWLQFPYLRSSRSGLQAIDEVLPGTVRRGAGGQWTDRLAWDPWTHVSAGGDWRDFNAAAGALRAATLNVVAAQATAGPLLLQLSGGVDSSIVAACLHHAGIPFSAVTFATRSADGDERHYARAVAQAFGAPLHQIREEELSSAIPEPPERAFRPGSNPILVPLDRAIDDYRRQAGARLLVDGGGGDNLFCYLFSAAPVLDAIRMAGPKRAIAAAHDVAARADCTLWEVARAALRRAWPSGWWRWSEDRRFLNPEMLLSGPDPHPWLSPPRFVLPGKRDHVASLAHVQHFLDRRLAPGTAALHPLMAQPLLELCLAIPTWLWVRGGIDRAVARAAFRNLLPAPILERRSKGSLQGLFHRSFGRLRRELGDLLLCGELRRLGIIDPAAVEQAFSEDSWTKDEVQMRLSEMAALELWLQSWRS